MARNPGQPDREQFDPEEQEAYDRVIERVGGMSGTPGQAGPYHGALLQSPPLAHHLSEFGRLVRTGQERGTYSHADRELVDVILSKDFGYNTVLPFHIPDALAVGVRQEAIEAIWDGREEDLNEDERLLADFIRRAVSGSLTDEVWSRMEDRMGARGTIEYLIFVLFLQMTLRLMSAVDIPSPSDSEIRDLIQDYREGKRELPDPDAHIR